MSEKEHFSFLQGKGNHGGFGTGRFSGGPGPAIPPGVRKENPIAEDERDFPDDADSENDPDAPEEEEENGYGEEPEPED
jgi:hypothetical protein